MCTETGVQQYNWSKQTIRATSLEENVVVRSYLIASLTMETAEISLIKQYLLSLLSFALPYITYSKLSSYLLFAFLLFTFPTIYPWMFNLMASSVDFCILQSFGFPRET